VAIEPERKRLTLEVRHRRLKGQGFGCYFAGSAKRGKAIIVVDCDALAWLSATTRGQSFKRNFIETVGHEFMHALEESFGLLFNEKASVCPRGRLEQPRTDRDRALPAQLLPVDGVGLTRDCRRLVGGSGAGAGDLRMTLDELLHGILAREGPGTPPYLDLHDRGGRTAWGIDERSHPEAWQPGPPTRDAAKAIYTRDYVAPFEILVVDDRVRVALVDDAVLSGVGTSIRTLQFVVGVETDGVIGPATIAAVETREPQWLLRRLVQERAHRLARIVEHDHSQARFVVGWIDRALSLLA
jgi:hypothetical protein